MNLYVCPGAPSPTRVQLYVAEKNHIEPVIEVSEVLVNLQSGQQRQSAHLARNRFGRVPVFEVRAGVFLSESLAIIEYLEECYPEPTMLGETALERAAVRALDRIAELRILVPLGRLIHATNSPIGHKPEPVLAEHFRNALPTGLHFMNEELRDGRPFVAGVRPTIADCTLGAALDFGRRRGMAATNGYPHLAAWFDRYRARTTVKQFLAQ